MRTNRSGKVAGAAGALLVIGTLVRLASATLVPGGGPAASDCYVELDVNGITASNVTKGKLVSCTDGDACDAGACGDKACTVRARVCWNQHDPNLATCTPPASLEKLQAKGKISITVPDAPSGSSCTGSFVDLAVQTKKNGKKPGKLKLKLTAKGITGTKPRTDVDKLKLICVPRTTSCPTPTTTTQPVSSTTSTNTAPPTTGVPTTSSTTVTSVPPTTGIPTTAPTTTTTTSTTLYGSPSLAFTNSIVGLLD